MEPRGAPLIEPAGAGRVRITFRYEDEEAKSVQVKGAVESLGDTEMSRVDGVWQLSLDAPSDLRTVYWFARNGEEDWTRWSADPLNPQRYVYPAGLEFTADGEVVGSMLELPDAPADVWSTPRDDVERGTLREDVLDGRRVWRYEPARPAEALLLLFDGHAYSTLAPAHVVLDNLIAAGVVPPMAALLPDSLDTESRFRDLGRSAEFLAWACDELLPWSGFGAPPERTVVAGSSMGGLAAAHFGLERPDLFGNVLAQSAAIPIGALEVPRGLPLRWYLDVGVLEDELLEPVRAFRDELVESGYEVAYREYPGGHDFFWWKETLAWGLQALLGVH